MKYGLHFISANKEEDWIRESNRYISQWNTYEDADDWRKKHTVSPKNYTVKKITSKILKEDQQKLMGDCDGLFKIE